MTTLTNTQKQLRTLAESYEADSYVIKYMPDQIGYGMTNDQWAVVYHTIASELYQVAKLTEDDE